MKTDQEQIDALKARVNYLREALLMIAMPTGGDQTNTNHSIAIEALEATPEQCLAEVKDKAIEDYKNQLAESKQLDLATKIMTVTI